MCLVVVLELTRERERRRVVPRRSGRDARKVRVQLAVSQHVTTGGARAAAGDSSSQWVECRPPRACSRVQQPRRPTDNHEEEEGHFWASSRARRNGTRNIRAFFVAMAPRRAAATGRRPPPPTPRRPRAARAAPARRSKTEEGSEEHAARSVMAFHVRVSPL